MITSHTKPITSNIQIKRVELNGISKSYRFINAGKTNDKELFALEDISLDICEGQIIGIIGRNGAGKTTLLNIIAGILLPTHGKLFVKGRVLGLFNLGVGFQDELTGRDNIFLNGAILGATRKELDDKVSSIIGFSELGDFINMPLGSYSQGMRLRLGFSIIANLDFDILVIDEVLAVGDALFQSKCFQRLMDFKRLGKTLIITTQNMELIERLCDEAVLLDHGHMLFQGEPSISISKYRALLNSEKFFVGPVHRELKLISNTKKWVDDVSDWGKKFGTKEIVIETVELINKFGFRCNQIKTGEFLRIKAHFIAKNRVKEPHFGVAIFREDGVYCYGPNTAFDGYDISEIKKGKGYFTLDYHKILLAPADYRISVAIWDKNETLAFDYHNGCYGLIVKGYKNYDKELLNMPFRPFFKRRRLLSVTCAVREVNFNIKSFKIFNSLGEEKDIFMTNELVKISLNFDKIDGFSKNSYLWLGIYRDDGIYCQGVMSPIKKNKNFNMVFPKFSLLPGRYNISIGVTGCSKQKILKYNHSVYSFRMVFDRQDHGTVYLEHKWKYYHKNKNKIDGSFEE